MTDGEHPANGPHTRTVEAGYDRVAEAYLSTKNPEDPVTLAVLEDLASDLPSTAAVLDLGCGAGIPVTRWLAHRGYAVTGVDVSARQLELARKYVPEATFIKADMIDLAFRPETFDAVVAFHSIIHVPREEHPALLATIHRWLKPGGTFMATLTVTEFEGEDGDWEGWGPRCGGATTMRRPTAGCCVTRGSRSATPRPAPRAGPTASRPGCGSKPANHRREEIY